MDNNYLKRSQKFVISVDEVDYKERLKPSAILQYFQDIATEHAAELGVGFNDMKRQNLAWVLSRVSAKVHEYPSLGQIVTLTTYLRKPNMVDSVRDYYVSDETGKIIISGTSKWCVISSVNHAIRRVAPLFAFDDSAFNPNSALEQGNIQLPKMDGMIKNGAGKNFEVYITDLDRNVHMNNAKYGDVIYNCCDKSFLDIHSMLSFDINFLAELKLGDSYVVDTSTSGSNTYFEATKNSDTTIFRAKIEWDKM